MDYVCRDRGTKACPCVLLESGQCYICNMKKAGKCSCCSDWQGMCPFTEYHQNGKKVTEEKKELWLKISEYREYSDKLKLIILQTSAGFALKCKEMGTFLMLGEGLFTVPLSVMKSFIADGKGYIHIAFYVAGPKTAKLAELCSNEQWVSIRGPFFNGLVNSEDFVYGRPTIAVAKGLAAMPFINQWERLADTLENVYFDTDKLTEEFVCDYLNDRAYTKVNLQGESESILKELSEAKGEFNTLLMVSPYYVRQFTRELNGQAIYPNHSNMCCGIGLCGACSHADEDGVTVKMCKCNSIIKKEA